MARLKADKPRGILNPKAGAEKFRLMRYMPATDLAFFVEHYWLVRWDLAGQPPYVSETLPHPSVHLVVGPGRSEVRGVMTGKFTTRLRDRGGVFGVKFRPGGFYPFLRAPVSGLTNRSVPLAQVFGPAGPALEAALLAEFEDDGRLVALAEEFLRQAQPERDELVDLLNQAIDLVRTGPALFRVEDLAGQLPLSQRTLQRLFRRYVGVGPKWVIKRYRLHEAAERLAGDRPPDLARLAQELGYFDQAHFIKDFKAIVGRPPAEYAEVAGGQGSSPKP